MMLSHCIAQRRVKPLPRDGVWMIRKLPWAGSTLSALCAQRRRVVPDISKPGARSTRQPGGKPRTDEMRRTLNEMVNVQWLEQIPGHPTAFHHPKCTAELGRS